MKIINHVKVKYKGSLVGSLAITKDHLVAFQYDENWIAEGFSVSPLTLPLESRVFMPKYLPFDGLFGVFDDSLPDGWGRLLVDRLLRRERQNPAEVNPVTRLAIVGHNGMGALEYEPEMNLAQSHEIADLDRIAEECSKMLETDFSEDLDYLFELGGSSGGARPKILTSFEDEEWLIKFPASGDGKRIGYTEYMYSLAAKECGIEMPETRLFPSKKCKGYFGVKRFDRGMDSNGKKQKVHMVSAGGLLESIHREPALEYHTLMQLTHVLTKNFSEVEKMYRLMCFNVFAHNRDDHSRNFSYLYDDENRNWKLSPAYDLTYSSSMYGQHATCVDGNGINPGMKEILAVAEQAGISSGKAQKIADTIEGTAKNLLKELHL